MSDTMRPLVSVFLPVYNHAHFLQRCFDGLLKQSFHDFELIMVDDGSTDATAKELSARGSVLSRRLGVETVLRLHADNKGTGEAINTAAQRAQGKYWTWISSDNVMFPHWLATLVSSMKDDVGAVYSAFNFVSEGRPTRVLRQGAYSPARLIGSEECYFGPSFLVQGDVWRIAGPHRGMTAHDYDHWARIEEVCWTLGHKLEYVDNVLCDYYSGPWGTVKRHPERYDAPYWRQEALKRRAR